MIIIFLLAVESSYFLQLSPGVMSGGLGGSSVTINEGLSVFHNPAYVQDAQLNVTLSRWFYSTNYLTLGATHSDYSFGISYLNYGRIQGYDASGNPTSVFTPYNLCVALGRRFGPAGLALRGFVEKIAEHTYYGLCGAAGLHITFEQFSVGMKLENLGKEISKNTTIPTFLSVGLKCNIVQEIDVIVEAKGPRIEINSGIVYSHKNLKLLGGGRYRQADNLVGTSRLSVSTRDFAITGGLIIDIEDYAIGYSIVYGHLSIVHQFSVTAIP
jgi:hypothetical protein